MRELLSLLPKPSRYLGIEEGSILKNPEDLSLRMALIFPDMYEVGMSYLGQKILYSIVNSRPGWQAERVFTPCREAAEVLRTHNSPLCSLESDTPLAEHHVLGISITHELCYTNVLYVLDLAGIPLRSSQRKGRQPDGKAWPLIIAGGGCTLSAEPLAPFVDIMVLGEAEEALPEILDLFEAAGTNISRDELLLKLSAIPGVYVPEFFELKADGSVVPLRPDYTKVTRRVVQDMDKAPYPIQQPIPFGAVHSRLALEIGRGCTRGCRFCQAGSIYRPARERSVSELNQLVDTCLSGTGYDDISFLSLSTGDYSALKELFMLAADRCSAEQVSLSLPSLRVGSIDNAVMEKMAGIRRTGATLAPEAGSQRLRDVINKGVTEEDLIIHVQKLFEHGWQQVKLYFMIGLPTETDEDLLAVIDLCRKVRDAAGPGIKRLQVTAAISPFVPKSHTPFQWEAQISKEEIRRRVGVLLDAVKKEKRLKLRWHEPEMSILEGLFSRGDRRLAPVIESAYRKGAVFSSWIENFSLQPWLEALEENGLSLEDYTRERETGEKLPWDHLHCGLSKDFFLREKENARAARYVGDCRYTVCRQCGVCDTKAGPSLLDRADLAPGEVYSNKLNNKERDQESCSPSFDRFGRVITRDFKAPDQSSPSETDNNNTTNEVKKGKAKPPAIASHLSHKAARWRLLYSRKGPAAYLSQLELQHIFDRAMRRSDIPLSFSQGFHPLPLVSFGRALPVGVESNCEWFSVFLREERPLGESLEALNRTLPKDLRITAIEELPFAQKSADAAVEFYNAAIKVPEKNSSFSKAFAEVAKAQSLPFTKEGKKNTRELDAKNFLTDISINADGSCDFKADWSKTYVSPLFLCREALRAVGFEVGLDELSLTKISAEF